MKNERRIKEKKYTLSQIAGIACSMCILFTLTFYGLFIPTFDLLDEWTDNLRHQAIASVFVVVLACGAFGLTFAVNWWRRQTNYQDFNDLENN